LLCKKALMSFTLIVFPFPIIAYSETEDNDLLCIILFMDLFIPAIF